MVLSPEMHDYAENLLKYFPDIFMSLGRYVDDGCARAQYRIVDRGNRRTIEISLPLHLLRSDISSNSSDHWQDCDEQGILADESCSVGPELHKWGYDFTIADNLSDPYVVPSGLVSLDTMFADSSRGFPSIGGKASDRLDGCESESFCLHSSRALDATLSSKTGVASIAMPMSRIATTFEASEAILRHPPNDFKHLQPRESLVDGFTGEQMWKDSAHESHMASCGLAADFSAGLAQRRGVPDIAACIPPRFSAPGTSPDVVLLRSSC
eukprot:TRINITY_DN14416_c0_g3_i1.p1 TRINITY_DN14416_c0_g3~~TRINITY_DN14416_c0_g3_i1.p1  ORF type:complete len:289 (+),score=18.42 TRINITY_DN14416_c0_g3_i1:68-868(+)